MLLLSHKENEVLWTILLIAHANIRITLKLGNGKHSSLFRSLGGEKEIGLKHCHLAEMQAAKPNAPNPLYQGSIETENPQAHTGTILSKDLCPL